MFIVCYSFLFNILLFPLMSLPFLVTIPWIAKDERQACLSLVARDSCRQPMRFWPEFAYKLRKAKSKKGAFANKLKT